MPKAFITLALIAGGFLCLQAQQEPAKMYIIPEEYARIHHEGEQALLQLKFKEALSHFKKVLKKFPDFAPAMRSAGACYELMGDFEKASEWYLKALQENPRFSRALYYECGKMLYQVGQYGQALKYFQQFDSLRQAEPAQFAYNGVEELRIEDSYYEKLEGSLRACNIALDSIQFWNIPAVTSIGKTINTAADEYFPFLSNDGHTIFYTTRKNENADENLFFSTCPKGDWRSGEPVNDFNSAENEGMVTMVRDGRRLFFTACQRENVLGPCDIWEARVDGYRVFDEKPANGLANTEAWESQASISCDGSTLYFASNREGGLGGTDIWVCHRTADGNWSEPQNLGPNINTSGDEEAPFITNDGKVLYFSSTGHLGLGEQDIFMSRMEGENSWSFAVNLGMPVNSAFRELGFYLTADGKTGYFASNRTGGQGGMDIYKFELPAQLSAEPITYVEGYVRDSLTHLPVKTTVHFKNRPPVETDENGRFFLCVKANDELNMEVRANDYHAYRNRFSIPLWDNRAYYNINLLLDPLFKLPVYQGELSEDGAVPSPKFGLGSELRHIVYFDFNDAQMKPGDVDELDAFLAKVSSGKPIRNIEIVGYADEIGTNAYNLELSEKRAKKVSVHLKEKGVKVNRIYVEGKGESNISPDKAQNRRVDVVVHLEN